MVALTTVARPLKVVLPESACATPLSGQTRTPISRSLAADAKHTRVTIRDIAMPLSGVSTRVHRGFAAERRAWCSCGRPYQQSLYHVTALLLFRSSMLRATLVKRRSYLGNDPE